MKYYECWDCGNEGFEDVFNTHGYSPMKCSCGSNSIEEIDKILYKCETCDGITSDRDYAINCCD